MSARKLSDLGDRSEQGGRARPFLRSFEENSRRCLTKRIEKTGRSPAGAVDQPHVRQSPRARLELAVSEGSDWFWWFGDDDAADSVSDFEAPFRLHLSNLYQLLGPVPPEYLAYAFVRGPGRREPGGTMRHGRAHN